MLELAIVAVLISIALGFSLLTSRTLRRVEAVDTTNRHSFLASYDGSALPADVLVQTWDALARWLPEGVREIRQTDRLAEDYGLARLDIEDVALLIAARCEGRIPTGRDLDELDAHVRTVDDLVRFVAPFCMTRAAA